MSVCLTMCRVSVFVALILALEADGTDQCEATIKVHHLTVCGAYFGEHLRIACPVHFCDGVTPKITWFKFENKDYTSVNLSDRVSTEWKILNNDNNEGIYFLIFRYVLGIDSGMYRCYSGNQVSHTIDVFVEIQRRTTYNATTGNPLKISCPVKVCDSNPPTVSWFKEEPRGLKRVNTSDRVTTEWTEISEFETIQFLIFQRVLSSDSGFYQCQSDGFAAKFITVFVNGSSIADPPSNSYFWTRLYGFVGVIVFFIVVASVYVFLKKHKEAAMSKTVAKNGSNAKSPRRDHALSLQTDHIYDNDL